MITTEIHNTTNTVQTHSAPVHISGQPSQTPLFQQVLWVCENDRIYDQHVTLGGQPLYCMCDYLNLHSQTGSHTVLNTNQLLSLLTLPIKDNNNDNNNNNERIYRVPFHVKHAWLRWTGANTKHMHIKHPKQQVSKQSCSNIQLSS